MIAVRINEPANLRIIIPALEVVHLQLGVVVISPVPQRVDAGQIAGGGEELAPGVVGVGGDGGSAGVEDGGYIALQVGQVVVGDGGRGGTGFVGESVRIAALVIEELQLLAVVVLGDQLAALPEVLVLHTVDRFGQAQAVAVVGIGGGQVFGGVGGTCQPSAVYPGEGAAVVPGGRISYGVIADGISVIGREQILVLVNPTGEVFSPVGCKYKGQKRPLTDDVPTPLLYFFIS